MTVKRRVAHLTSVHARYDTRIFLKQCRSLAAAGYEVFLVVADGKGGEARDGVTIIDVGKSRGRMSRMLGTTRRVYREAIRLDAHLYQFHDPELLPIGYLLKRRGKRVIYDAHEDVPLDILSKDYLRPMVRRSAARTANACERFIGRRLDAVVTATPAIRDKFAAMGATAVDINNFPMLGELDAAATWDRKACEVCYIGGISRVRGIDEVLEAMAACRSAARLNLVGSYGEGATHDELSRRPGWDRVNELGFLPRAGVRDILARSMAGIVTLHPTPAFLDSLPIKMFEYMSAGLPVIASHFPLWKGIVEGIDCGICVDPLDTKAIAGAIDHLVEHPDVACRMGERGRRAVLDRYNWDLEATKLLELYRKLIPQ